MTNQFEPIAKTAWICPHCEAEHDTYEKALRCANTPVVIPKFKAGDTVYVMSKLYGGRFRGDPIPARGLVVFCKRTVIDYAGPDRLNHRPCYLLLKSVKVCGDGEIGCADWTDGDYWGRPAWESELLQMGQSVDVAGETVTVCPETIANY